MLNVIDTLAAVKLSPATGIGFYELARTPECVTLAPTRAVYVFPEGTPKFVSIYADMIEVFYEDLIVTSYPDVADLDTQLYRWVAEYRENLRKAKVRHEFKETLSAVA